MFTYGGNALEIVNEYTYLGVTMNYNGKFNKAIAKQVDQARRAMYGLISKCKKTEFALRPTIRIIQSTCITNLALWL